MHERNRSRMGSPANVLRRVPGRERAPFKRDADGQRLWTTAEVAEQLGVHRNTVLYWARHGKAQAWRQGVGTEILVPDAELARLRELHAVFEEVGGLTADEVREMRRERRP